LESKNIEYEFVNVKKLPIEKTKLNDIAKEIGMDLIFNMKGPTFRKMKLDYSTLNDSKKLDLLFENQNMIKRPLIEKGNKHIAGYDEDKILDFINT
jgi:Spx/MgsR family transcriptional regulator